MIQTIKHARVSEGVSLGVVLALVATGCSRDPFPVTDAGTDGGDTRTEAAVPGAVTQRSCATGSVAGCGTVYVPRGTFTMGDERIVSAVSAIPTQANVTVGPFFMDRYEVTVARFRRFWASASHAVPGGRVPYPARDRSVRQVLYPPTPYDLRCNWSDTQGARESHPLNCVPWDQAQAFCVWDADQGATGPTAGRLPTEAEWEFAARGTDGRRYPWGDTDDPTRVCAGRPFDGATPLTCPEEDPAFLPGQSPFGLLHMAGNVEEWTADHACPYGPGSTGDGGAAQCGCERANHADPLCMRHDLGSGDGRVVRGGAWYKTGDALTTATRVENPAGSGSPFSVGFRCVRSAR